MLIIFMKYPKTTNIIEAHEKFIEHAKQKKHPKVIKDIILN